jgi:hypothetical protein
MCQSPNKEEEGEDDERKKRPYGTTPPRESSGRQRRLDFWASHEEGLVEELVVADVSSSRN